MIVREFIDIMEKADPLKMPFDEAVKMGRYNKHGYDLLCPQGQQAAITGFLQVQIIIQQQKLDPSVANVGACFAGLIAGILSEEIKYPGCRINANMAPIDEYMVLEPSTEKNGIYLPDIRVARIEKLKAPIKDHFKPSNN